MFLSYYYTSRTVPLTVLYRYSWHSYKRIRGDGMLQASFRLFTFYENSINSFSFNYIGGQLLIECRQSNDYSKGKKSLSNIADLS